MADESCRRLRYRLISNDPKTISMRLHAQPECVRNFAGGPRTTFGLFVVGSKGYVFRNQISQSESRPRAVDQPESAITNQLATDWGTLPASDVGRGVRLQFMLAPIDISGIVIHEKPEVLHVQSSALLTTLSSSFFGGGFRRVRHILNANVPENYRSDNPSADMRAIAAGCDVGEPFVGLLTAVPLRKARASFLEHAGVRAGALITAGVGNATCAGVSLPYESTPGTINIIVLLDAKLTRAAMLNAVVTVTEAKSAVLYEMKVCTPDGAPATGTSTDTVTIAMTGAGPTLPYAGPATVMGWLIAKTVRQALQQSLLAV